MMEDGAKGLRFAAPAADVIASVPQIVVPQTL
jgi:hypothetical protein